MSTDPSNSVRRPDENSALEERNIRSRSRRLDQHIVLVGFMGAGKSSLGLPLAQELGRRFVDSDTLLQQRTGSSVQELFSEGREPEFRALEEQVVAELLAQEPAVIALGGGALMSESTRARLRDTCFVIHLYLSWVEVKAALSKLQSSRPLLQRPMADIHELYIERQKTYRDADVRIHVPRDDPSQALRHVMYALRLGG